MTRIDWPPVLARAAELAASYSTPVTLRQLYYRLVAELLLENTITAYKGLSARTAQARRDGVFPYLMDSTRTIHRYRTFDGDLSARDWLRRIYRRDRTEGQAWSVYLGVEKRGIVAQLQEWFGALGVPVLALGGYAGQGYVDDVIEDVSTSAQDRPAVLLYAGDHDPSGEDIDRDFTARADCFAKVERVALDADQVEAYRLPPQPGKTTDSRAAGFVAKHGRLIQVELDALDPNDLHGLYRAAIDRYWDVSTYEAVLALEATERGRL